MSEDILPMFSSRSFTVACLLFRSLSNFEFTSVYSERLCYNFIDLYGAIQFSQHHLLKRFFSPLYMFASFVDDQLTFSVWVDFWTLSFVPLIHMSVSWALSSVSLIHMFVSDYFSFAVFLMSGRVMCPALFFFFRTALLILGLLRFYMMVRIIYSSSVKSAMGNLIEITLNLQIALGSIVILTV